MKKGILLLITVLTVASAYAQTAVKLKINHKLKDQAFAMSQASSNDLGQQFNVTRLQYYISGLSIVHDGGQVADAFDVYLLVDAGNNVTFDLGNHTIDSVEAINFSIGVDPGVNNEDPAQWPPNHALSPKSPTMHWGWTAGYRFVAMEGKAGSSLSTTYELHALGNNNYFQVNIPTGAAIDNGSLVIELNADYAEALRGIGVEAGVVVHGDNDEALKLLKNFNSFVFTSLNGEGNTLSVNEAAMSAQFSVAPNPTTSEVVISVADNRFTDARITVTDVTGKVIVQDAALADIHYTIAFAKSGIYFATMVSRNGLRSTQKIVVQ